ncbi:ATP-binding cassette domain-containing protein [Pedobacter aquatilis]|uniref:ATP-binding cassette domain-containing protein n=1 Tax=Pedobacter aquatilis TaxID=351343 RepID=UPI0025B2B7E0|nr:ATP-binding cassette domain-containing protein [Pedobacter aquatilis]MDN3588919.1 ATP-binding cassette domain-containing protein [Pedobacter aquatilis]
MQELTIDSVTHNFNKQAILNGVFINCKIGEIVGLLGRNGSGKSTLLKIIFGSVKADFKFLKINESIIDKGYLSQNLSYLPQDNFIPLKLTVKKAVEIFCSEYKSEILKIELIANNLNYRFCELSGGNQRLIEALVIIYGDAEFILLDEPFSQLAPLMVEELKFHIDLAKKHKGVIITDHYYNSIIDIADRIVLLHNGCNYQIKDRNDLILYGYLPENKY